MNGELKEWVVFIAAMLLFFGLLGLAAGWVVSAKCEREWQRSSMKSEWGFPQGCMVQRGDGTWIPSNNFREIGS